MALMRNPVSTRLSLKFYVGDDLEGNPIARQTSYQVKSHADDQDLYDVALALASLSAGTLVDTILTETNMLEDI